MDSRKRKVRQGDEASAAKKKHKQWKTPKKNQPQNGAATIQPGDAGIWATCDRNKEARAAVELRDILEEHARLIHGEECLRAPLVVSESSETSSEGQDGPLQVPETSPEETQNIPNEVELDIEAEIAQEIQSIKKPSSSLPSDIHHKRQAPLFQAVRIETPCLLFFKTRSPVDPVSFVQSLCKGAADGKSIGRSRYVRRMTPITRMGKATSGGLEQVGNLVLPKVFQGGDSLKFAIRPSIRNHNTLSRDEVIHSTAKLVGPGHKVDLTGYDFLILVDIYQNMLGMSVVGKDYEELRRFNISEIYCPTPQASERKARESEPTEVSVAEEAEGKPILVKKTDSEGFPHSTALGRSSDVDAHP